jgi:hypothetical protein
MQSTVNARLSDLHDILVAPDFVPAVHADQELSSPAHDAVSRPSAPQTAMPQTAIRSDFSAITAIPAVDTTFRPTDVNHAAANANGAQRRAARPTTGRRAIRGLIGFLLAVCIGAAAHAWQTYGDVARQMIAGWTPQFAQTSSPPVETAKAAEQPTPEQPTPSAVQAAAAATPASTQPPPAETAPQAVAPTAAEPSPEQAQLQSMAGELAAVKQQVEQLRAGIEQIKASQEQMSRGVAKASEAKASEVRPPDPTARPRVSALQPRPPAPVRKPAPSFRPRQAVAAPPLPQNIAPAMPRQAEPQPSIMAPQPQDDLELTSAPRPPMPVR